MSNPDPNPSPSLHTRTPAPCLHLFHRLFRKTVAPIPATRDRFGFLPDPYVTYRVPTDGASYMVGCDTELIAPGAEWTVLVNHMHRRVASAHWLLLGAITPEDLGLQSGMTKPLPL